MAVITLRKFLLTGSLALAGGSFSCKDYIMQPSAEPEFNNPSFASIDYFFSPNDESSARTIVLLEKYLGGRINLWCTAAEDNNEDKNKCEQLYGQTGFGGVYTLKKLGYDKLPLLLVNSHSVSNEELCSMLEMEKNCLK